MPSRISQNSRRPRTQKVLRQLRQFESQNITFIDPDGSWPIVWERAQGTRVWDVDGKEYLDLTAAFGVTATGHANPAVVRAAQQQLRLLPHAMGDVHPHPHKAALAKKLSQITFERWHRAHPHPGGCFPSNRGKVIFCNSGFEAVEAALKTALLVTGKHQIIAFTHGYHGLGYGALNTTSRDLFRTPFLSQLGAFGNFAPFPLAERDLRKTEKALIRILKEGNTGAIMVEPIQARGGINIPPPEFLPRLRKLCDRYGALLILDEIFTGFGRTGAWFACEHSRTTPDLICLGKALTGGFPLSACVGRAALMDEAWPPSSGEAIHTSTFLGNPVGCSMALAQIDEIKRQNLIAHTKKTGSILLKALAALPCPPTLLINARGLGLIAGLELRYPDGSPATDPALLIIKEMLARGFVMLPEGDHSNVLSFTPPLLIKPQQLLKAVATLGKLLRNITP